MTRLTHVDDHGAARMVDVGGKEATSRRALAEGRVAMAKETLALVRAGSAKGDVLQVARVAGIQGAKRTADLIPLCHPLGLDGVRVDLRVDDALGAVVIEAEASTSGRTGVEMEALTAVATAALTVYDMVKAVDRDVVIGPIFLREKDGGSSGPWRRERAP